MVTFVGMQNNFNEYLKQLIALEYDVSEAYSMAIDRVNNVSYKEKLTEFRADHERHIKDLSQILAANSNDAVKSPDLKQWLAKMMIGIGELLTSDQGILRAISYVESDTNAAYAKYTNYTQEKAVDAATVETLQHFLEDERRHKQWIDETLLSLK